MKKLMMAMAAVAMVSAANAAATYNYNSTLYFSPNTAFGDTGSHASWYKAYALEESDWKNVSGTTTVNAFASWLSDNYSANAGAVVGSAQALSGIKWEYWMEGLCYYEQTTSSGSYGSNLDKGVIVFMYQDESDNYAFAVETSSYSTSWDVSNDSGEFFWKTLSWTAVENVPEPTSGLLMLLGMAGLALKRKRA